MGMSFYAACRAVIRESEHRQKKPEDLVHYAAAYAKAGLAMTDPEEIEVQCLYILSNLAKVRSPDVSRAREVFKDKNRLITPLAPFHGVFASDPSSEACAKAREAGTPIRDMKDYPFNSLVDKTACVYDYRWGAIKVGDYVRRSFYKPYQHGFTIVVTGVKKMKSGRYVIEGTEVDRSYGAGTDHYISDTDGGSYTIATEHMTTERLTEIANEWRY